MKILTPYFFLLLFSAYAMDMEKDSETEVNLQPFHLAADEISPNPKSGFTNVYDKGGMSIGYFEVPSQTDFTPLFKGLPHDMCTSPLGIYH